MFKVKFYDNNYNMLIINSTFAQPTNKKIEVTKEVIDVFFTNNMVSYKSWIQL